MKKLQIAVILCLMSGLLTAQSAVMTPELLWDLGRVSGIGLVKEDKTVVYSVRRYDVDDNTSSRQYYTIPLFGGEAEEIGSTDGLIEDKNISPSGKHTLSHRSVKINNTLGKDFYPEKDKSEVYIYDNLMNRHWDTWSDGSYNHVFVTSKIDGETVDVMETWPFHCPTMPFGGSEDYLWNPDGDEVIYVTKQKTGREYTTSTNTDIFSFNLKTKRTKNLTEGRMGYDNSPAFSSKGVMAWLSMERNGYEADKNDIIIKLASGADKNLTAHWDGTVSSFFWGKDGAVIFFIAPIDGTKQLFSISIRGDKRRVTQITKGQFDVRGIVGESKEYVVVSRTDMNHAVELYVVNTLTGDMRQLTHVNDEVYGSIQLSKVESRYITTSDNKQMLTWVIYPPDFDPTKKYPTLLYCQGGPQGALSQFYSFRWNFQLMAAQGYIVVAPNRRGMPGYGVEWNEQISKDYGGQNMKDYLSAIDVLSQEDYVDNRKIGAVGASYGGYSVFYLAGIHKNRFRTFISHDGMFNLRSMYGTTEEMFFVNWDLGGPYWDKSNAAAQKSFNQFNPIDKVAQWNKPILIFQGGKDYRVPIGQGLEAFQAAQLRGIKSRLVYLPTENHWVLSPQNGIVWQREFFRWLDETM